MLFKNATIYTMEEEPFIGDFRVDKGVFTEIGKNLEPKDEDIQDLSGFNVYPGMVEAHCHLGMEETAIGFEGNDLMKSQIQSLQTCVALMVVIQWMKLYKLH